MRRIIDGKRYDTGTATEVAAATASVSQGDFFWWSESLHQTPQGNWFLSGEGGAMSHWSRSEGDGRGPGRGIKPLSASTARAWLEDNEEIEALETYFGEEIEDA